MPFLRAVGAIKRYMRQLPSMGDYLTNGGDVNLSRVDIFLGVVGITEDIVRVFDWLPAC